jgi:hypothetical protein
LATGTKHKFRISDMNEYLYKAFKQKGGIFIVSNVRWKILINQKSEFSERFFFRNSSKTTYRKINMEIYDLLFKNENEQENEG